jgi:hypothetical protein
MTAESPMLLKLTASFGGPSVVEDDFGRLRVVGLRSGKTVVSG